MKAIEMFGRIEVDEKGQQRSRWVSIGTMAPGAGGWWRGRLWFVPLNGVVLVKFPGAEPDESARDSRDLRN